MRLYQGEVWRRRGKCGGWRGGGENSVGFSLLGFCCAVCVLSVGHVLRGMLSRRYALGTKFTLYAYKLYACERACVRACVRVCVCVRACVRVYVCVCERERGGWEGRGGEFPSPEWI